MSSPPNITDYDPTSLKFYTRWEEFDDMRHPEDGEMLLGQVMYAVAEAPDGAQFYLQVGECRHKVITPPEFDGDHCVVRTSDWKGITGAAHELARKLNLLESPRLNPDRWGFARAVYGSECYQRMENSHGF